MRIQIYAPASYMFTNSLQLNSSGTCTCSRSNSQLQSLRLSTLKLFQLTGTGRPGRLGLSFQDYSPLVDSIEGLQYATPPNTTYIYIYIRCPRFISTSHPSLNLSNIQQPRSPHFVPGCTQRNSNQEQSHTPSCRCPTFEPISPH